MVQDLTPEHHERLIRWWQDEIEGTGKVPILSAESKPEVLRFGGGTDADLRLQWQEFLLRIVADAFDLPPFYLGVERDVNRSTAEEYNDMAFRQAIVPTARLLAESLYSRMRSGRSLVGMIWSLCLRMWIRGSAGGGTDQQILLQTGVLTVNEVRRMREGCRRSGKAFTTRDTELGGESPRPLWLSFLRDDGSDTAAVWLAGCAK